MARNSRVHDRAILDALDAIDPESFEGEVWRIVRKGRDALRGASAHGRWGTGGEFEVLYASLTRDGALAEVGHRLSLEPIWPSLLEHEIHSIAARTERTLRLADVASLGPMGVDITRYEDLDYGATQAIAAAAHFLEFDGLLVPSARAACSNLVIFLDRILPGALEVTSSEIVDWNVWRRERGRR